MNGQRITFIETRKKIEIYQLCSTQIYIIFDHLCVCNTFEEAYFESLCFIIILNRTQNFVTTHT